MGKVFNMEACGSVLWRIPSSSGYSPVIVRDHYLFAALRGRHMLSRKIVKG